MAGLHLTTCHVTYVTCHEISLLKWCTFDRFRCFACMVCFKHQTIRNVYSLQKTHETCKLLVGNIADQKALTER